MDTDIDPLQYRVTMRDDEQIIAATRWCLETIGPQRSQFYGVLTEARDGRWRRVQSDRHAGTFYFKREQEAFSFKLRWG